MDILGNFFFIYFRKIKLFFLLSIYFGINLMKKILEGLENLNKLSLCGTNIFNLWTTVGALKPLKGLRELTFSNYENTKEMIGLLDLDSNHAIESVNHPNIQSPRNGGIDNLLDDENEVGAETIVDTLVKTIGDLTISALGSSINHLSSSFKEKISKGDWKGLEGRFEVLSNNFQLHVNDLPQRIQSIGQQFGIQEISILGHRLNNLSTSSTIHYISKIRQHLSSLTGNSAASMGNLITAIQTVINRFLLLSLCSPFLFLFFPSFLLFLAHPFLSLSQSSFLPKHFLTFQLVLLSPFTA